MSWLEEHAAYGRIAGEPVKAVGWMAASFRHATKDNATMVAWTLFEYR